jgi:magnesium transporter
MNRPLDRELTERLETALRLSEEDGDEQALVRVLEGVHPADVAEVMRPLDLDEAVALFESLDDARAAEVLDELDPELVRAILEASPRRRMAELLDRLPMDDAAEVLGDVTPEQAETLLADLTALAPKDAAEVRELLSYPPRTAGRLMTDKFIRLTREMSAAEAFDAVRTASAEIETVSDLYVVEPYRPNGHVVERLVGVISLRELIRARPEQRVAQIMVPHPVTVNVDTDQEDVARLISKYDFLAVPVIDREGGLAGIVTVDDVIDVLVEEFNEDYLRLVGSDAEEMDRRTPVQVAKLRLPFLMGTMAIELLAGLVIARYSWVVQEVKLLPSFMPVISAISGNVGIQAAAIVVRGLETGHVSLTNRWRSVAKELQTSLLIALCCGLVLGTVGAFWSQHATFGVVIGVAMTCSIMTAGALGTVVPMLWKRLGFDPAATAGPFETAFQDVIGFAVILWLASMLLPWLVK